MFFKELLNDFSFIVALWGGFLIAFLVFIAKINKRQSETLKKVLFTSIAIVAGSVTLYIAGHTVYENVISESRGPVHWHADFKIYNCDEEVNLKNPAGLVNRIGSPVLHEHGDNRIHIEGVVVNLADVSLAEFFSVIGGEMKPDLLSVPTNDGVVALRSGDQCKGQRGFLQMFKYSTEGSDVTQEKIIDFPNYMPAPHAYIPPGDCIIIELDRFKDKTDKICTFYELAIKKGELHLKE